mgnify:FL=1
MAAKKKYLFLFNSKKNMWIALSVAVILLYFLYAGEINAFAKRSLSKGIESDPSQAVDNSRVLRIGDSGQDVMILQNKILQSGGSLPKFGADGIFGKETQSALNELTGLTKISLNGFDSYTEVSNEKIASEIA